MNEEELKKLIETEQRSKSNCHRIDSIENEVKNNNELALSVKELTVEIRHMREDYQKLAEKHNEEVKAIDNRLTQVESKPARRYEDIVKLIITNIVTAVLVFLLSKFGL